MTRSGGFQYKERKEIKRKRGPKTKRDIKKMKKR